MAKKKRQGEELDRWNFLSNHALVLLCIARFKNIRMRDVAERIGITERAVQRIVADLERTGYISRKRDGRRNRYEIHENQPLRHPLAAHRTLQHMLSLLRVDGKPKRPERLAQPKPRATKRGQTR